MSWKICFVLLSTGERMTDVYSNIVFSWELGGSRQRRPYGKNESSLLLLFVITSCLMMHFVSLEDTIFSQFGSDREELLLSFRQVLSFNLDRLLDWHTTSRTDLDTILCSKWTLLMTGSVLVLNRSQESKRSAILMNHAGCGVCLSRFKDFIFHILVLFSSLKSLNRSIFETFRSRKLFTTPLNKVRKCISMVWLCPGDMRAKQCLILSKLFKTPAESESVLYNMPYRSEDFVLLNQYL